MRIVKIVIDMLEKSSDRRENTWDYRDRPLSEIVQMPWAKGALARRKAKVIDDRRFRLMLDDIIAGKLIRRNGEPVTDTKGPVRIR